MKKILAFAAVIAALMSCSKTPVLTEVASLNSPDGNLKMTFSVSDEGEPVYALNYKDKNPSLDFTMAPGGGFAVSFRAE